MSTHKQQQWFVLFWSHVGEHPWALQAVGAGNLPSAIGTALHAELNRDVTCLKTWWTSSICRIDRIELVLFVELEL